MLKKKHLAVGQ